MRTEVGQSFVTVALPGGQEVKVEATGPTDDDGLTSVGLRKPFDFESVLSTLGSIGGALRETVASAAATRTTVEVRLGFSVEAGKLVAVLLGGTADAAISVTYEWSKEAPAP